MNKLTEKFNRKRTVGHLRTADVQFLRIVAVPKVQNADTTKIGLSTWKVKEKPTNAIKKSA